MSTFDDALPHDSVEELAELASNLSRRTNAAKRLCARIMPMNHRQRS